MKLHPVLHYFLSQGGVPRVFIIESESNGGARIALEVRESVHDMAEIALQGEQKGLTIVQQDLSDNVRTMWKSEVVIRAYQIQTARNPAKCELNIRWLP